MNEKELRELLYKQDAELKQIVTKGELAARMLAVEQMITAPALAASVPAVNHSATYHQPLANLSVDIGHNLTARMAWNYLGSVPIKSLASTVKSFPVGRPMSEAEHKKGDESDSVRCPP